MKILVLGIGNLLFGDEGIGVHFINYIGEKYRFEGGVQIDLVDGGTLAQRLIPIIVEYDHVIIVDTINTPGPATGVTCYTGNTRCEWPCLAWRIWR